MNSGISVSQYFSEDLTREATVLKDTDGSFSVRTYEVSADSMGAVKIIDLKGKNQYYAEDVAENFVLGIGSFRFD